MRLGIGSYAYAWACGVPGYPPERPLTAAGLVRVAHSLGVHVVQICDNLPLDRLSPGEIDALAALSASLGVSIEVGTRGIAPEQLSAYVDLAVLLGSPILRVVVDTATDHPSAAQITAMVRWLLPRLRDAGVTLAIENHDRFRARVLRGIMEDADSERIGICLDTVNSLGALEGPDAVMAELAPWVVSLHVKDFVVCRVGHAMGFVVEGRPAGEGMLDLPWLFSALARHGRDPNAILELWTPPEPTLAATIDKEALWVARSVVNLRALIPA